MTQTFKIFTAAVIKIGVVFLQHNIAELQITFRMLKFSRQLWHLNPVIASLNQIYILDIFFLCLHETITLYYCFLFTTTEEKKREKIESSALDSESTDSEMLKKRITDILKKYISINNRSSKLKSENLARV